MKYVLAILGVLLLLGLIAQSTRGDYAEFDRQREAWHRRCDAYVGKSVSGAARLAAESCQRELRELSAYAERKGWKK